MAKKTCACCDRIVCQAGRHPIAPARSKNPR
jgi:hypothetical protein